MKKGVVLPLLLLLPAVALIVCAFFLLNNKPRYSALDQTQSPPSTQDSSELLGEIYWNVDASANDNTDLIKEIKDTFKSFKPKLPDGEHIELTLIQTSNSSPDFAIMTASLRDSKNEIIPSEPFNILLVKSEGKWVITPDDAFCETLNKFPEDLIGSRREYYRGCFPI